MLKGNNIYIGEVVEGSSKDFIVEYEGSINYVKPKCGSCTKVLKIEPGKITFRYTASEFPFHLKENKQPLTKLVDIFYNDGTEELLSFRVINVRK